MFSIYRIRRIRVLTFFWSSLLNAHVNILHNIRRSTYNVGRYIVPATQTVCNAHWLCDHCPVNSMAK